MSRRSDQALAEGSEHFAAQRYEEAQRAYQAALDADPSRYEARIGLTYCAIGRGEGAQAIDALVESARTHAHRGDPEAAFALFDAALELAPERLELHVDVAELENKLGWTKAAADRLSQLAQACEEDGLHEEARAVREVLRKLVKPRSRSAPPPPPRHKLTRANAPTPSAPPPPPATARPVVFRDTAPLPIRRRDTAKLQILQPATLARAMRPPEPNKPVVQDTAPLRVLQPIKSPTSLRRAKRNGDDAPSISTEDETTPSFVFDPPPLQASLALLDEEDAPKATSVTPPPVPPVVSTMPKSPLTERLRQRATGAPVPSTDAGERTEATHEHRP